MTPDVGDMDQCNCVNCRLKRMEKMLKSMEDVLDQLHSEGAGKKAKGKG